MPPGAPDWHLPPPETPMIWEGLSDSQASFLGSSMIRLSFSYPDLETLQHLWSRRCSLSSSSRLCWSKR
jgi:hypothetical protein